MYALICHMQGQISEIFAGSI